MYEIRLNARHALLAALAFLSLPVSVLGSPAKRPITFDDILARREFPEVSLRQDGKYVAFVVKQARVKEDDYVSALHLRDTGKEGADILIAEGKKIGNVSWKPDSGELTYRHDSRVMLLDPKSRESRPLNLTGLESGLSPSALEWSPDGSKLAALVPHTEPELKEPFLYHEMHYENGSSSRYRETSQEIVLFDAGGSLRCRSGQARWASGHNLRWGQQGGALALSTFEVERSPESVEQQRNGVLVRAVDCKQIRRLDERGFTAFGKTDSEVFSIVQKKSIQPDGSFNFSPRSHTIVRASLMGEGDESTVAQAIRLRPDSDEIYTFDTLVFRAGELLAVASDRRENAILKVDNGALNRIPIVGWRVSGCSFAAESPLAACVVEAGTVPPEIAIVDLRKGSVRRLTRFNAAFDGIELGKVERVEIPDDRGRKVTMHLVYPTAYEPGKRYPAIVTMYGTNGGFVDQAQYMTSYAPQVWAAHGYFTLLWNAPPTTGGAADDFAAHAWDFQLRPFAVTKNAVKMLIDRGLAKPDKIGVAGHSMGSHWSDYAIAHSDLFAAASSHAPGGYSPIAYWESHIVWRQRLDRLFGGPPVGKTLAAWQALAPAFFPPPHIPQLREVPDSEVVAEFAYRHWVDAGAPVEMVVYPNETHVFGRPQGRLHSLELNTDWFDFWLRGVESGLTGDAEQYVRWRAMRVQQCELFKGDGAPWYC